MRTTSPIHRIFGKFFSWTRDSIILSAIFTCMVSAYAMTNTPSQNNDWIISSSAFGPIQIGMSTSDAETASKKTIVKKPLGVTGEESCRYATFADEPSNVLLMLNNDIIVRIDIKNSQYKTALGAHVNTTAKDILSLYSKKVEIVPDKYNSAKGWQNLIVSENSNNEKIFQETGHPAAILKDGGTDLNRGVRLWREAEGG